VADDAARFDVDMGDTIGSGQELRDVPHRRRAVRPDIGSHIDMNGAAQALDRSVTTACYFNLACRLASMGHGREMLAPIFGPLDRASEPPRCKGQKER